MIHLSPDHLQALQTHAQTSYPQECCGLLIGKPDDTSEAKVVKEVWATENAWNPESAALVNSLLETAPVQDAAKTERYWIAPETLLAGQRYARDRQLEIIGIYHSHPDHPALPSEMDRRLAWPQYSYMIMSVRDGTCQDPRAWCLDQEHNFQAEVVISKSAKIHSAN